MALALSEDAALTVRASPSASWNTPDRETCRAPVSLTMVASEMELDTVGAWLDVAGCWPSPRGVVWSPFTRTHWLDCFARSSWNIPV